MKRFLILAIIVVMTSGLMYAQDFRKSDWGMSKDQVKNRESSTLVKDTTDILEYTGVIAGYKCIIRYKFTESKLSRASYIILNKYDVKNDYIKHYDLIKGGLSKKYGVPREDEIVWLADYGKSNYSEWGDLLGKGHLIFYSSWGTEKSSIFHTINGQSNVFEHIIEYNSKKLSPLEDRIRYKRTLRVFSENGFRKSKWGYPKASVKNRESSKLTNENSSLLTYNTRIARFNLSISYFFTENKLTSAQYLIIEEGNNKMDYVDDYNRIKSVLINKYGKPKEDKKIWAQGANNTIGYSQYGNAVSKGVLNLQTVWVIENSVITLNLTGGSGYLQLVVHYESVKLKEFKDNYELSVELEGF